MYDSKAELHLKLCVLLISSSILPNDLVSGKFEEVVYSALFDSIGNVDHFGGVCSPFGKT